MKKLFRLTRGWEKNVHLRKIWMTMKLTSFLFFLSIMQMMASGGYSQTTKLTLQLSDVAVKEVLNQIEANSEFFFLYNSKLVDVERKVNVDEKDQRIDQILDNIFQKTDVVYAVIDRQIVLNNKADQAEFIRLSSQQVAKTVTGTVKDNKGQPLPGASVVVKGTTIGAMTDDSGNYAISLPADGKSLVFSLIGLETKEIAIGNQTQINVTLTESLIGLDEVVIVGYSTQAKKSLTGSVSTVNSAALSRGTLANPISRLQGQASGVTILNSHLPGGEATVNIRGLGTINDNTPLYVIDGVPTKTGTSLLNANEIESISVLKDASSAAIYGARGANGVIIITTKRGTSGKMKVSFTGRYGVSSFNNWFNMATPAQNAEGTWMGFKARGVSPSDPVYGNGATPVIPDYIVPVGAMEGDSRVNPLLYNHTPGANWYQIEKANKTGTNWWDVIKQNGPIQEYNVSLSGGGAKGSYAINLGYMSEGAIVKFSNYDRYNIRSNADTQVTDWLKIGESLSLAYSMGKGSRVDNTGDAAIGWAWRMNTIFPVYDIQGNFAGNKGTPYGAQQNPLAFITRHKDDIQKSLRGVGNVFAEFQIMKGLTFKSLFGFDYLNNENKILLRLDPEFSEGKAVNASTFGNNYTLQWNSTNILNYTKIIAEKHKLNLLLGQETVVNEYNYLSAGRSTFYSEDTNFMYLDGGQADQTNSGNLSLFKTSSYFGRLNYDYMGKYLLEGTFRRDGSSRFGANNRWANFPAASVGWRVSEENFMEGSKAWLNSLKIRGGIGVSGNDEIGNYNGFSTFASNVGNSFYSINGNPYGSSAGFYNAAAGNPDAKWETTTTKGIGLDFGLLKNTLTGSIDLWQRKTSDMLLPSAIPMVAGAAVAPSVNVGDMDNKGFDIDINYANTAMHGDLHYSIGLTLSHYKNEILKLTGLNKEFITNQRGESRAQTGTAFPEFYGMMIDGIFQTSAEAAAYIPQFGTYNARGHYKFRDVNGDGKVDANDRTYIGSPHPKFTTGLNMGIGYKAFNLTAFWYASIGNKILCETPAKPTDGLYYSFDSPYLKNNADAKYAIPDGYGVSLQTNQNMYNGSYARLKTVQLSYTLPKKICQKLTIGSAMFYIEGENLITITHYPGLDPELSVGQTSTTGLDTTANAFNRGIDNTQWPTPRQIMLGIKLDF